MPLIDPEDGLTPAMGPSDTGVAVFFRELLPDFYFVNTPVSRMRRHLALLERLAADQLIIDFHRPPGAHFTELALCAYDDVGPGLLAKLAGTMNALKMNIHTAWVHTLADPLNPASPRQVVLDTLILSEPYFGRSRPLTNRSQAAIKEKLTAVLGGSTTVGQLMVWRKGRPNQPLNLTELTATEGPDHSTLIRLRAVDQVGVLYRVAKALAALDLNVAHAQINTFESNVDDLFFVRRQGKPLTAPESEEVLNQLRANLESDMAAEL